MTAPLVRRTTLRGLWDALKRSSPLYTAFSLGETFTATAVTHLR